MILMVNDEKKLPERKGNQWFSPEQIAEEIEDHDYAMLNFRDGTFHRLPNGISRVGSAIAFHTGGIRTYDLRNSEILLVYVGPRGNPQANVPYVHMNGVYYPL